MTGFSLPPPLPCSVALCAQRYSNFLLIKLNLQGNFGYSMLYCDVRRYRLPKMLSVDKCFVRCFSLDTGQRNGPNLPELTLKRLSRIWFVLFKSYSSQHQRSFGLIQFQNYQIFHGHFVIAVYTTSQFASSASLSQATRSSSTLGRASTYPLQPPSLANMVDRFDHRCLGDAVVSF